MFKTTSKIDIVFVLHHLKVTELAATRLVRISIVPTKAEFLWGIKMDWDGACGVCVYCVYKTNVSGGSSDGGSGDGVIPLQLTAVSAAGTSQSLHCSSLTLLPCQVSQSRHATVSCDYSKLIEIFVSHNMTSVVSWILHNKQHWV